MARFTLTPPAEYAGKSIHMYDYAPTGRDIINTFTAIHGQAPALSEWSEDELEAKKDEGHFGALEATLTEHCTLYTQESN